MDPSGRTQSKLTQLPLVLHGMKGFADGDLLNSIRSTGGSLGLDSMFVTSMDDLVKNNISHWRVVIVFADESSLDLKPCWKALWEYPSQCPSVFTIVYSSRICEDARCRLDAFSAGARMLTDQFSHIKDVLQRVVSLGLGGGDIVCPTCGLGGLTENELHLHHPLFHSGEPNSTSPCPICHKGCGNFALHLHNDHGPIEDREPPRAPYSAFAWVVCRHQDGRFLMVNEPAGISRGVPRYWLPAGRVDIGESLLEAARRETLEEGGIEVRIIGVLRFLVAGLKYPDPCPRIVFLAEPCDPHNALPKSIPDWESVGAFWVSADSVQALKRDDFRSPDPFELFPLVASGELRAYPVDVEAFRRFDELIVRLTAGARDNGDFARSWKELRKRYPSECFIEH